MRRLALLLLLALGACKPDSDAIYQGYAEGEYLRMAPEAPGRCGCGRYPLSPG
jgi:hypothetical protein